MNKIKSVLAHIKQSPDLSVKELIMLVESLRPSAASNATEAQQNLDFLVGELKNDSELLAAFQQFIKQIINSKNHIRLFTELGISPRRSFITELLRRLNERILPDYIDKQELLSVIADTFYEHDDYQWVEAVNPDTWCDLFELMGFKAETNRMIVDEFNPSLLSSAQIIASRITSLGLEPEMIIRLPHIENYNSPFQVLSYEVNKLVELIQTPNQSLEPILQLYKHILVMLTQCREAIDNVRRGQKRTGVSISLVYLLLRIEQNIERLGRLLGSILGETKELRLTLAVEMFTRMIRFENQKHGVRQHIQENTEMLAYQVVEHTSQTGEHYITNTPKQYYKFLLQSMAGGLIISFTTWLKFILASLKAAPLVEGFLFSLNYAGSFIAIFVTHSTLATKQPSMTASALASALDDQKHHTINLDKTAELIVKLSRSQFVSFLGNLIIVIPLPYLIAWAYHHFTGQLIVNEAVALKTVKSIDPVHSLSVLYAATTGVFLFISGIINGFYDNVIHYGNVGKRIRNYRLLQKYFSQQSIDKISYYVERNYGGLMGNLFLGFFLGFAGTFGQIAGLPFDIRHVTLAGGSFAMAYYTLGDYLSGITVATSLLGVFLIGLMNFLVSFSLSLFVALRSRKVNFKQTGELFTLVLAHFFAKPLDFFYPPRKKNLSLAPDSTLINE
ncbi:site-specific recombinase [Solitalea sp. MAHUQ-68]|uniref:Site-specific recombinase n=1 Tax=Solitalea agri TaxID=2953739 RepID=A0A9X2F9P3_9SPHI|nr:site-specific recombinase [Solitalea agri]MCO4293008.1 site-specific recombinase [Solitalea agri]